MRDPEILAPVGNRAMLDAALAAGADAVYLGGRIGNARAFANNFSDEELREAVQRAHLNGTKVYVTLNTLVKNDELDEHLRFVEFAYHSDVDALILQDLGLARAIHQKFPGFPIHASTQLNTNSLAGVRAMESMGFERVILGREVPLDEVRRIRAHSSIEIELFVHGSLCVSVSGQCLFSSFIGGRSGNRGRCAQSCRKNYQRKGNRNTPDTLLSMRDLNTLDAMDLWKELGIASLKIEGRMKKPAYVYAVTKMLQAARAGQEISSAWVDVSSRAFTKGFTLSDFGRSVSQLQDTPKGSAIGVVTKKKQGVGIELSQPIHRNDTLHVWTTKRKLLPITVTESMKSGDWLPLRSIPDAAIGETVYRVYAESVESELQDALGSPKLHPLHMTLIGRKGDPLSLTVRSGTDTVHMEGEFIVQEAQKQSVSGAQICDKLEKTGNTAFSKPQIELAWDDGLFVPMGEVTRLRREALVRLEQEIGTVHSRADRKRSLAPVIVRARELETGLTIEIDDNDSLHDVCLDYVQRIYTSDTRSLEAFRKQWGKPVFIVQPEPLHESREMRLREILTSHSVDGVLCKEPACLRVAAEYSNRNAVIDSTMNIFNDRAVEAVMETQNVISFTPSIELSLEELGGSQELRRAEHIAFGPTRSMLLRHCPFSMEKGCVDDSGCSRCGFSNSLLVDEHGAAHPIVREDGYSTLYFYRCLDRIEALAEAPALSGTYRLILKNDPSNPAWVGYAADRLIRRVASARPQGNYWKTDGFMLGSWKRGIE